LLVASVQSSTLLKVNAVCWSVLKDLRYELE
jgi:hypothetical protein